MSRREASTAADWAAKPRSIERLVIDTVTDAGDSWSYHAKGGTGFMRSKADIGEPIIGPDDEIELETVLFSRITGLRVVGEDRWRFHLSDQDMADEHNAMMAGIDADNQRRLDAHRAEWSAMEAGLSDWLRERLARYRANCETFDRDGWGYELMICVMADLFVRGDTDGVEAFAREQGVSGNQYECAKALAEGHNDIGAAIGELMPAGISPITGSADYS